MKQKICDFFKIFLAILMIPIFALAIVFWVTPCTIVDAIRESKYRKEQK